MERLRKEEEDEEDLFEEAMAKEARELEAKFGVKISEPSAEGLTATIPVIPELQNSQVVRQMLEECCK